MFQEFMDRLLKTAHRIFRDPQAGFFVLFCFCFVFVFVFCFVTQLSYENANAAVVIQPYKKKYLHLS